MEAKTTVIAILLFMSGVIFVGCGDEIAYQPSNEEYVEYVEYVVTVVCNIDWSSKYKDFDISNIKISQGVTVNYNPDENYRVFFITYNGEYALLLLVTYLNNTFHCSYGFDNNTNIDTVIKEKTPIALFVLDLGVLVCQTEYGCFQISSFNNFDEIQELFPDVFSISYEKEVIVMSNIPVLN